MIYLGILLLVIGGLMFFFSTRKKKTLQGMASTKSMPIKDVQPNTQVEIQGNITTNQPLLTPFSKRQCVYYSYDLERQVEKRDQQGNVTYNWETISRDEKRVPFIVQDDTGQIMVNPEKATIDSQSLGQQFVNTADIMNNPILSTISSLVNGARQQRVTEKALCTDGPAYIYGYAVQGPQGLFIQNGENKMLISYKSEEEMEKSMGRAVTSLKWGGIALGVLGLVLAVYSLIAK